MKKKMAAGDILNYFLLLLMGLTTIFPLWYILVGSLTSTGDFSSNNIALFPGKVTFDTYIYIFKSKKIFNPLGITVFITLIGTVLSLFVTAYSAYGFSKKFPGSKIMMYMVVVTMFVNSGLIPQYILLKKLNLINNLGVYIFPSIIGTFQLLIMRTQFMAIPAELEESARIDGCGPFRIFLKIILPLSIPTLAAMTVIFGVAYWNTFMPSMFFITDPDKKSLQDYLYGIVQASDMDIMGSMLGLNSFSSENLKMANTIIAILPIVLVYPFMQRYFVKGIMLGALKG